MMIGGLLGKVGSSAATGMLGVVTYDAVKRVVSSGAAREGAVTALSWGLRGRRQAEIGAENTRLVLGDLMADARARVGEQVPPPGADVVGHDHEH